MMSLRFMPFVIAFLFVSVQTFISTMTGKHQRTIVQTDEEEILLIEEDEDILLVNEKEDDSLLIEEDEDILLVNEEDIFQVDNENTIHSEHAQNTNCKAPWKILIVDDEPSGHQATQLALTNFRFRSRPLLLLHAYSGAEAKTLLKGQPDISFVLLDVVMETHDAGLKVVQYIRNTLKNKRIQIILRMGQPGEAPETSIIQEYEINDYKLKTELTRQRLMTTVTTALRGYCNVVAAEEKNIELEQTLNKLQQTQRQLVHSEKMSVLGNLVAGVAHEIHNPVNCIMGNVDMLEQYTSNLLDIVTRYANHCPNPGPEVEQHLEALDLGYVREDLPQLLRAMKDSGDRIFSISTNLCTFSRADSAAKQAFNLHHGIESTLLILRHRLKANTHRPAIEVIKNYGDIPDVQCFQGQINQVFMNILANAIDALDEASQHLSFEELETHPQHIAIRTGMEKNWVKVCIADNGPGISTTIQNKIFDHLFTTKSVGKGTGLGLAIAHQIVVDHHGGILAVQSKVRRGTEFIICLPIDGNSSGLVSQTPKIVESIS